MTESIWSSGRNNQCAMLGRENAPGTSALVLADDWSMSILLCFLIWYVVWCAAATSTSTKMRITKDDPKERNPLQPAAAFRKENRTIVARPSGWLATLTFCESWSNDGDCREHAHTLCVCRKVYCRRCIHPDRSLFVGNRLTCCLCLQKCPQLTRTSQQKLPLFGWWSNSGIQHAIRSSLLCSMPRLVLFGSWIKTGTIQCLLQISLANLITFQLWRNWKLQNFFAWSVTIEFVCFNDWLSVLIGLFSNEMQALRCLPTSTNQLFHHLSMHPTEREKIFSQQIVGTSCLLQVDCN